MVHVTRSQKFASGVLFAARGYMAEREQRLYEALQSCNTGVEHCFQHLKDSRYSINRNSFRQHLLRALHHVYGYSVLHNKSFVWCMEHTGAEE